jgi:biliverdin reductase
MPETIKPFAPVGVPLRVGIVGTGFAAKIRAQTVQQESRTELVAIAGSDFLRTRELAADFGIKAIERWQDLVTMPDLDLIIVATVNSQHAPVVKAALTAGKHTIVEYPLALDPQDAAAAIDIAERNNLLLHVEHIELLGSLHQTMRQWIGELGNIHYARYTTIAPQRPSPHKWTYNRHLFGFPLSGALSRLHRFSDLFGAVERVFCQTRYWQEEGDYYRTCMCSAQLEFSAGMIGEVVYGKGEGLWQDARKFEVHGERGALIFNGDEGILIQADVTTPLDLGSRQGLFAQDTRFAIDALLEGTPNYIHPRSSLATLRVADAARISAASGSSVKLVDLS